jgi:hypothetical protein
VAMNGLKAWVIVVSGELSIVTSAEEPELLEVLDEPPPDPEDPQAASPSARTPAAATVSNRFWSANLLMESVFPVVMDGDGMFWLCLS